MHTYKNRYVENKYPKQNHCYKKTQFKGFNNIKHILQYSKTPGVLLTFQVEKSCQVNTHGVVCIIKDENDEYNYFSLVGNDVSKK